VKCLPHVVENIHFDFFWHVMLLREGTTAPKTHAQVRRMGHLTGKTKD
jgi:hypothetical protein